jgi:hypothetical protein
MTTWQAYLVGLGTIPGLVILTWLVWSLLERRWDAQECLWCDWAIDGKYKPWWVTGVWSRAHIYKNHWHEYREFRRQFFAWQHGDGKAPHAMRVKQELQRRRQQVPLNEIFPED